MIRKHERGTRAVVELPFSRGKRISALELFTHKGMYYSVVRMGTCIDTSFQASSAGILRTVPSRGSLSIELLHRSSFAISILSHCRTQSFFSIMPKFTCFRSSLRPWNQKERCICSPSLLSGTKSHCGGGFFGQKVHSKACQLYLSRISTRGYSVLKCVQANREWQSICFITADLETIRNRILSYFKFNQTKWILFIHCATGFWIFVFLLFASKLRVL